MISPSLTLADLKKGLGLLENEVKTRKEDILGRLHHQEKVTDEESDWLDNAGNLVDEEHLIMALEVAKDFDNAINKLDGHQKVALERLKSKICVPKPSAKRKRA